MILPTLSLAATTICIPSSQSPAAARSKSFKFSFATSLQSPRSLATTCSKPSDLSLATSCSKPLKFSITASASSQRLTTTANFTIYSKPSNSSLATITSLPNLAVTAPCSKSLKLKFSLVSIAHIFSLRNLASAHPKSAKSSTAIITS
jgi:hypothetical protein